MSFKTSLPTIKIILVVVLAAAIIGLSVYKLASNPSVKDKLSSSLTPARDLRGTWISSLSGKGCQLQGQFTTEGTVSTIYEDGDIELIITDVKDNIAYGTFRYTNLCAWGFSVVPQLGKITVPKNCLSDSGPQDIQIKVSSSALDFGTITTNGVTTTMTGSYTTDLMHGTMTATVAPYGEIKGVFNLNRQR